MPDDKTFQYEGYIETITYQNSAESFLIGKLKTPEEKEPFTFKGTFNEVEIGDSILIRGYWETHPNFGNQLNVSSYEQTQPQNKDGLIKYLCSSKFKKIGEKTAKEIVKKFGLDSLTILEKEPKKLLKLPLMNEEKLDTLIEVHEQQKGLSEIFIFLYGLNLPKGLIQKIYESYGVNTISMIEKNPYIIAQDIKGIGFKKADSLASKKNIPKNSPERAKAATLYFLEQITQSGHTCYPLTKLVDFIHSSLLNYDGRAYMEERHISDAIHDLIEDTALVFEDDLIFTKRLYYKEQDIAFRLKNITSTPVSFKFENLDHILLELAKKSNLELHVNQETAIKDAIKEKIMIITGGPGTGKTTIVKLIIELIQGNDRRILLATPTGKAAKRLEESTGKEVKTIHRILETDGTLFQRNLERKLECDLLIIDEFSMVDTSLFLSVLNALPDSSHLILVGDIDQLPSIGAGAVLRDLLETNSVHSVRLNQIFRQAEQSLITVNAHQIIQGLPLKTAELKKDELSDFYWIPIPKRNSTSDSSRILKTIKNLFMDRIPNRFGIPSKEIQILTSIRKGSLGIENLNKELQSVIHPKEQKKVSFQDIQFFKGDRVMQTINDYDLSVFNGDQGFIQDILKDNSLLINFDNNQVVYKAKDLKNILPSWATTIHKSQGSEFPAVILVISDLHQMMLYRNLIYTGLTRASKLAVMIGEESAIQKALATERNDDRFTHLQNKLKALDV